MEKSNHMDKIIEAVASLWRRLNRRLDQFLIGKARRDLAQAWLEYELKRLANEK